MLGDVQPCLHVLVQRVGKLVVVTDVGIFNHAGDRIAADAGAAVLGHDVRDGIALLLQIAGNVIARDSIRVSRRVSLPFVGIHLCDGVLGAGGEVCKAQDLQLFQRDVDGRGLGTICILNENMIQGRIRSTRCCHRVSTVNLIQEAAVVGRNALHSPRIHRAIAVDRIAIAGRRVIVARDILVGCDAGGIRICRYGQSDAVGEGLVVGLRFGQVSASIYDLRDIQLRLAGVGAGQHALGAGASLCVIEFVIDRVGCGTCGCGVVVVHLDEVRQHTVDRGIDRRQEHRPHRLRVELVGVGVVFPAPCDAVFLQNILVARLKYVGFSVCVKLYNARGDFDRIDPARCLRNRQILRILRRRGEGTVILIVLAVHFQAEMQLHCFCVAGVDIVLPALLDRHGLRFERHGLHFIELDRHRIARDHNACGGLARRVVSSIGVLGIGLQRVAVAALDNLRLYVIIQVFVAHRSVFQIGQNVVGLLAGPDGKVDFVGGAGFREEIWSGIPLHGAVPCIVRGRQAMLGRGIPLDEVTLGRFIGLLLLRGHLIPVFGRGRLPVGEVVIHSQQGALLHHGVAQVGDAVVHLDVAPAEIGGDGGLNVGERLFQIAGVRCSVMSGCAGRFGKAVQLGYIVGDADGVEGLFVADNVLRFNQCLGIVISLGVIVALAKNMIIAIILIRIIITGIVSI